MKNKMLENALAYLKKGMSVIPVGVDKKPIIAWQMYQEQLPTEKQVKDWWEKNPFANIGIITGKISGITVVDVEKDGDPSFLPATLIAKTGGGGWHYYYKYAEGIGNKARIRPYVDIRGNGGFVVVPPSKHSSGNRYEWVLKEEMLDFPEELLEIKKEKKDWKKVFDGVGQGSRNDTAAKLFGKLTGMFDAKDWETMVWRLGQEWNRNNTPSMEEDELRAVYESIVKIAMQDKRGVISEDIEIAKISEVAKKYKQKDLKTFPLKINIFDDNLLGGFKEGDLVIISAPTGEGKTSYAQTLTVNLSENKISTLWFTYEVLVSELWRKFQNMGVKEDFISYVPFKHITGKINWIEEMIIKAKSQFKTDVIFIDHLGFLLPSAKKSDRNLSQNYSAYLGSLCRELKSIALNNNIAIVLMVHVRKTDNLNINDIRDSSGIAQEADIVFLLERIKAKTTKTFTPDKLYTNTTKITLAKNRRTGITKIGLLEMINDKFVVNNEERLIKECFGIKDEININKLKF